MSSNCPNFLVQTQDGVLHAYFNPQILRIDLATNRDEEVKLFKVTHMAGRTRYKPTTKEEIEAERDRS